MGGVVDMESARRLVGDKTLWPLMRDFLWDFAPQIHPSNLPEGFTSLSGQSSRIKRYVLNKLEVQPFFHTFPQDDWSRLALLDGATLESIAKWLGALSCAASLRRIMDGAKVRALKAAFPAIYPDVFAYTAYFKDFDNLEVPQFDGLDGEGIAKSVISFGCGLLFSFLPATLDGLMQRIKLKLPGGVAAEPSGRQTIKSANLQKLLRIKFPEAFALCCS